MATANGTPTDAWSLVITATAAMEGGVSCQYVDIEIATTPNATAPAATIEGHYVPARHTEPVHDVERIDGHRSGKWTPRHLPRFPSARSIKVHLWRDRYGPRFDGSRIQH